MANNNISPQVRTTLETLRTIGTPAAILGTLEQYARRDAEVRAQDFKREKEGVALNDVRQHTVNELRSHIERAEKEAAAERDKDLARVEGELKQARAMPARETGEADSAYLSKVVRRQIEEARDHAAIVAASADVSLALALDDAGELEALVTEALEGGHPEHIRRVARAVSMRLNHMAIRETQEDAAHKPAAQAAFRTAQQVREWRARESEKSPAVRKQRILATYENRVRDTRQAVIQAAAQFNLREMAEPPGLAGRFTKPGEQ